MIRIIHKVEEEASVISKISLFHTLCACGAAGTGSPVRRNSKAQIVASAQSQGDLVKVAVVQRHVIGSRSTVLFEALVLSHQWDVSREHHTAQENLFPFRTFHLSLHNLVKLGGSGFSRAACADLFGLICQDVCSHVTDVRSNINWSLHN